MAVTYFRHYIILPTARPIDRPLASSCLLLLFGHRSIRYVPAILVIPGHDLRRPELDGTDCFATGFVSITFLDVLRLFLRTTTYECLFSGIGVDSGLLHFLFLFLVSLSGRQGKWQSHHTRFNIWRRAMVFLFGVIFMGLILWVRYYFLMGAFLYGFWLGTEQSKEV